MSFDCVALVRAQHCNWEIRGNQVFSGVLRKAADAVRGTSKPITTVGFLKPIDTAWIARDFELDRIAAERANSELPPTNSSVLDAAEQQIVQKISSEWSWQGGELINNLRAYAQRLIGYSIGAEFTKLQISARDTLAKLRAAHHRAEAELGPLREEYLGFQKDLLAFKAKNRLSRPAKPKNSRWTTFGLLSVFIAVESLLNGLFFAKGSEFGLIGGVGIAIGISAFNVIVAFAVGLFPARGMHHRNLLLKFSGLLFTSLGAALLVGLHAFAAHYRDAVAAVGEDRAMHEAYSHLTSTPWALGEINSYYLFGLGLLFSISAFAKGFTFDDPYPRYGAKSRLANSAREEYSDEHARLFDELEDIKTETLSDLDEGITRIPLFPQQAANIRAQRAALIQTFRGYEDSVVVAANQLLSQYRDVNRKQRKSPPPIHFDEPWSLPHSFLHSPEVKTLTADTLEKEIEANTALLELKTLSQAIIEEYEKLMISYPHPTKMDSRNVASAS